jgi:murein DD-endopeptidase MepM/ murein hydrolase activator NlpD
MRRRNLIVLLASLGLSCAPPAADRPASPDPEAARVQADRFLPRDSEVFEARVPRNATLGSLLRAHEISEELAGSVVDAVSGSFDLRRLRADQPYRLVRSMDGFVREFVYKIDTDRFLHVVGLGAGEERRFDVEVVPYEKQRTQAVLHGVIDRQRSSLVASVAAGGETVALAMALADVFGGDIDFNNDLQPGDSFDLVFEKETTEGEFAGYGPVLAATFRNDGRTLQAYRFTTPGAEPGYYDERGRSLKRFFLRSPLQFEPRISSGFSYQRLHPILGVRRPHPAIDYRAPLGAPVVAIATGVVELAGWSGGGGKTVLIRHSNGYESSYMHLSAFARGIAPGVRVAQGQVIGRVGATGLATGPHLDYRLRKNGVYVNPLVEQKRLPPGEPIPPAQMAAFSSARDALVSQLGGPVQAPALASLETPAATTASAR